MGNVMLKELLEKAPDIAIEIVNLTSETQVKGTSEMLTLSLNGCVLKMPKASCSNGHQVRLKIYKKNKAQKKKVEIIGKILGVSVVDEKTIEVSIHFNQFVKEEWLDLLEIFELRQAEINKILDKLKTPQP